MRILQLSKKFPFPLKDGETIAVHNLSKALTDLGAEVSLLAMNTSRHYSDTQAIPEEFNHYSAINTVNIDNRIKPVDAFLNLFSKESYHIARFISKAFEERLIQLLQNNHFDIVQLETLYLVPYIDVIRRHSKAQIALRSHNVEYEIWERITRNTGLLPKKWYLSHLTEKLKQYELDHLNNYELLVPITEKDQSTFHDLGFGGDSLVTPIGLEMQEYKPDYSSYRHAPSLCFIGSLDWMPNLEGLSWFLDNAWERLKLAVPGIEFHIAGRNTPQWLKRKADAQLHVVGEVACAKQFINQHSLMVVPLFSGSGMRAKILEGMALGKVVISTSLGLEGINAVHKRQILVADTADEFIKSVAYCFQQNGQLKKMGEQARFFVENGFDNKASAKKLLSSYKSICGQESEKVIDVKEELEVAE